MIRIDSLNKDYDSECQRWVAINPKGDFNPKDIKLPDYLSIEDLRPPDVDYGFRMKKGRFYYSSISSGEENFGKKNHIFRAARRRKYQSCCSCG